MVGPFSDVYINLHNQFQAVCNGLIEFDKFVSI